MIFNEVKEYTTLAEFVADSSSHAVPAHSPHAFKEGGAGEVYGWVVSHVMKLEPPLPLAQMRRLYRSVFELQPAR